MRIDGDLCMCGHSDARHLIDGCAVGLCRCGQARSNNSPSVDRFVPSMGYVIGNVHLICWRCNNLKRDATPEELLGVAQWMSDVQMRNEAAA